MLLEERELKEDTENKMKLKKVERKEKEKDSGNVNQKLRERDMWKGRKTCV